MRIPARRTAGRYRLAGCFALVAAALSGVSTLFQFNVFELLAAVTMVGFGLYFFVSAKRLAVRFGPPS
jgi:hypothetical protein